MRFIIGVICISLIIIRAIWPNFKFDNISLILFVTCAIVLLFPELWELIRRVRKVRIGDFEVEIGEKLKELATKTENVETNISEVSIKQAEYQGISDEVIGKFIQTSSDPRAALLMVAIEIERTIRSISDKAKIPESRKPYPISRVITSLAKKEIINPNVVPIFKDFWAIRNKVVHGLHFELSSGKLYELIALGLRILRLLSVVKIGPEKYKSKI